MKILIYGINYAPEPTGIGKYTGEMATWLATQGHEVRVVAAPPYYPAWRMADSHAGRGRSVETMDGVQVWRCPLWVPARPNGSKRVLHLLSFALSSLPTMLRQARWKPDVVWVAAPAFACTPAALLTARLAGARAWLHIQDYEVDVAFDMGLLRGRLVRSLVLSAERWLMRRFDVVSSISRRMVGRAVEKGVAPDRAVLFPNWVDVDSVKPLGGASPYRAELQLPPDAVVALFSGTLGAKQGLHLIPLAARLLRQRCPNLVFVVCGDGQMRPDMEAAARELPNMRLLPLQPKERLPDLLGMADIHLLPQDPGVADLVMPSKLTAMLSSGRPVVTNARPGSEVAEVVAGCGVVVSPDDAPAFAGAVEGLAADAARRARLGAAARLHAEQHLGARAALGRFSQRMELLTGVSPLPAHALIEEDAGARTQTPG
ncbi:glycosyltransferase WbuB [Aquincola sp. J276]|uniref:glycosyltransferase WbuB n=1 Tax=Aquincola sp. J276 TaxID=2898432 RepID=UPI002150E587|nr:glycosyltransferase WbuB [Aquincola sp. J276]MCR5865820.1 glycosyltransferase WbuB [Aquincola sp. J276]